jgi:hypothetical protein
MPWHVIKVTLCSAVVIMSWTLLLLLLMLLPHRRTWCLP